MRRLTMAMRERLVVSVILSTLKSDGTVVDSRPFPVVLSHLGDVEEE
jgi:hypothetical protein